VIFLHSLSRLRERVGERAGLTSTALADGRAPLTLSPADGGEGLGRIRARGPEIIVVAIALLASACEGLLPEPDFERMINQDKAQPYEAQPLFADNQAMRMPPAGTVAYATRAERQWQAAHRDAETGIGADGHDVAAVPEPLTAALLQRGRDRFEIVCATCHGPRGDGVSEVARHMELRKPSNLLDAEVRGFSAGRLFRIITRGYGLMPSYERDLGTSDRWAVVAYLRALQLGQAVSLDALPRNLRRQAEIELE
jgi:mono/diheme cytochrome c family protein